MVRKKLFKHSDNKLTELEYTILESFFPEADDMTINNVIERCGYSYERVNTTLKLLEKKQIVKSKNVGKTLVYTADYHSLYLKLAFYHYMMERKMNLAKKHLVLYKSLKKLSEDFLGIVILFGSYSKGNETKSSDIDLMAISENQKEIKEKVNKIISTKGFNISLANIKKQEFSKIKKENPELWTDLREYAIVFSGQDSYYYWMYQNE